MPRAFKRFEHRAAQWYQPAPGKPWIRALFSETVSDRWMIAKKAGFEWWDELLHFNTLEVAVFATRQDLERFANSTTLIGDERRARDVLCFLQDCGFKVMLTLDEVDELLARNPGFTPDRSRPTRFEQLLLGELPAAADGVADYLPWITEGVETIADKCAVCIVEDPGYSFQIRRYLRELERFATGAGDSDLVPSQRSWLAVQRPLEDEYEDMWVDPLRLRSCIDPRVSKSEVVMIEHQGRKSLLTVDPQGFLMQDNQLVNVGARQVWHAPDPLEITCVHRKGISEPRSRQLAVPLDVLAASA